MLQYKLPGHERIEHIRWVGTTILIKTLHPNWKLMGDGNVQILRPGMFAFSTKTTAPVKLHPDYTTWPYGGGMGSIGDAPAMFHEGATGSGGRFPPCTYRLLDEDKLDQPFTALRKVAGMGRFDFNPIATHRVGDTVAVSGLCGPHDHVPGHLPARVTAEYKATIAKNNFMVYNYATGKLVFLAPGTREAVNYVQISDDQAVIAALTRKHLFVFDL